MGGSDPHKNDVERTRRRPANGGPLAHIRVLELAAVLAGPSVGQFLAEQGARVIKIENPRTCGDVTRSWLLPDADGPVSAYFQACNWGKESVGMDLSTPHGRALMHELASSADIVISSFLPGSAARLGADYATLSDLNDRLIVAEITGYGPDSDRAGYDAVIQAEAGYYHLNRRPGEAPAKMPVALMDELAAHQLKEGVLLALFVRERTGRGTRVSVSLFDAALSGLANQGTAFLAAGRAPRPSGSAHPVISPYGSVFMTSDDRGLVLAVGSDRQFLDLCALLGRDDIARDPAFLDNESRVRNRERLGPLLASSIREMRLRDVLDACHERRIPAGAVRGVDEAFADAGDSVLLRSIDEQFRGLRQYVGRTVLDQDRLRPELSPPPAFGSSTRTVLRNDLGLSDSRINELLTLGTISDGV